MRIVYKSFLYEAWDLKAVKEKFGKQLEEYLKKYNDSIPVEEYFNKIYEIDPSADKKYLGAITKWVLEKRPEDLETQIQEYLGRFKKLLDANPGRYGTISRSIVKGLYSLDQFKQIVNTNDPSYIKPLAVSEIQAKERIRSKTGDFPIVGENEGYVCYKIDKWVTKDKSNKPKHFCFSGNVDWCIKYRPAFEEHNPPYYYFLDKSNGDEFALLHIPSLQLKDINDNALKKEDFLKIKDMVVEIISSSMIEIITSWGETDFSVIIENVTNDEFRKIFSKPLYINSALTKALFSYDDIVINKLFEVYSSEELLSSGNQSDIISLADNFIDQYTMLYRLKPNTVKKLIDNFDIDPTHIFKEILSNRYGSTDEISDKIWYIESLLAKEYIDPNEMLSIKTYGSTTPMNMTAFEYAIFRKAIGAVEIFLKDPDVDVNSTNLAEDRLLVNGCTPLYYIANLGSYEHDVMFSLLIKDPRVNVNSYCVIKTYDGEIVGRSVLDLIGERYSDRIHDVMARGGKKYKDLVASGEIPEYNVNQKTN